MDEAAAPPRSAAAPLWALSAATGLLLVLALPPLANPVASFVALVPLSWAVARLGPGDPRRAARLGLTAGLLAWAVLMAWIPGALSPVTRLALPLYVAVVGLLSIFPALFAWIVHRLRFERSTPLWLAVPVAWTATEWLRAHLGPLSFPWLELGVSLWRSPRLAGVAELVGVRGLGFWIALVCGGATVALESTGSRRRRALFLTLCATAAPPMWGIYRMATLDLVPLARVAVVQPNVLRAERAAVGDVAAALAHIERLQSQQVEAVDLVVWPEAAVPGDPRRDPDLRSRVGPVIDGAGAPVLFGVYLDGEGTEPGQVVYNGALLWNPGSKAPDAAYRKRRLVPGVETIPFIGVGRAGAENRYAGFASGGGPRVLRPSDLPPLSPLICYESIFSRDARAAAREGGRILVNLSNDEWFGAPGAGRRAALVQHPAHLTLRAIELRQGVVRAANTGISLFVDPLGRTQSSSRAFEPALLVDTVYGTSVRTLYARLGDWVGLVSMAAALLGLLFAGPRSGGRRDGGRTEPAG